MKPQTRSNRGVLASPHASAATIVAAVMRPLKCKGSRRKKLLPPPKYPEQEQSAPSPERTNPSDALGDPSAATTAPDALNSPGSPAKG